MLGRSGDGGTDLPAADGDASTTTIAASRTTLPISGDTIERADFDAIDADPPSSTQVERATTTVQEMPTVEAIEIDPRLQGTPLRLVGSDISGSLAEIDLENGVRTDYISAWLSPDPSSFVAGDDWVLMDEIAGSGSTVLRSDGSRSSLSLTEFIRPLPIAGTDMLWTLADPSSTELELQRVDIGGELVPGVIELPSSTWPVAIDPATGGVIVQAQGRVYSMLPAETTYLGIGMVVAVSPDQVLLGDCDEQFVCGLRLVDRSSGDVVIVPGTEAYAATWQPGYAGVASGAPFSPDGRWAPVVRSNGRSSEFGFVDVGTGAFESLVTDPYLQFAVWTPDGEYVVYLDAERKLSARDLDTGETFAVLADFVSWNLVAARPISGPADEAVEG